MEPPPDKVAGGLSRKEVKLGSEELQEVWRDPDDEDYTSEPDYYLHFDEEELQLNDSKDSRNPISAIPLRSSSMFRWMAGSSHLTQSDDSGDIGHPSSSELATTWSGPGTSSEVSDVPYLGNSSREAVDPTSHNKRTAKPDGDGSFNGRIPGDGKDDEEHRWSKEVGGPAGVGGVEDRTSDEQPKASSHRNGATLYRRGLKFSVPLESSLLFSSDGLSLEEPSGSAAGRNLPQHDARKTRRAAQAESATKRRKDRRDPRSSNRGREPPLSSLPTVPPQPHFSSRHEEPASLSGSKSSRVTAAEASQPTSTTTSANRSKHLRGGGLKRASSINFRACDMCSTIAAPGQIIALPPARIYCGVHCLRSGESIYAMLDAAVSSTAVAAKPLLALTGKHARYALNIMQQEIDNPTRKPPFDRDIVRRLMLKLALLTKKLPSSLFIINVTRLETDCRNVGAFSDIYIGEYKGQKVALKSMRMFQTMSDGERARVLEKFHYESLIWRNLRHQHILQFYGIADSLFTRSPCMVLPWMPFGHITKALEDMRVSSAPREYIKKQLQTWVQEIVSGLQYLHDEHVVHGDLRGPNILIDNDLSVRLADFGLAVFAAGASQNYASSRGGNVRWMAPELILPEAFSLESMRPTYASDVYSFGCVIVELFSGKAPYPQFTRDPQVITHVTQGLHPSRPLPAQGIEIPDYLWKLATKCFSYRPSQRPTARMLASMVQVPDAVSDRPTEPQRDRNRPAGPRRRRRRDPNQAESPARVAEHPNSGSSSSNGGDKLLQGQGQRGRYLQKVWSKVREVHVPFRLMGEGK